MLVVQLKKEIITQKLISLKKKLNYHNHDKYITLVASVFNARSAQAKLMSTNFDAKLLSLNRKITSNKTKHLLVESELKKLKHLIQGILLAKVILKIVHKIIQYFSQCTDVLNELLVVVMAITFITGNLKDFLIKN